jgi:hypothetical protein
MKSHGLGEIPPEVPLDVYGKQVNLFAGLFQETLVPALPAGIGTVCAGE